ncbi:MAG TPA: phosphotransferase family protein [bacterium]|nr:phosphotransferase family protein [bacterium]
MESVLDQTAPIRKGEELDLEAVRKYLVEAVPGLAGEIEIEQFPSGHSNLTYFVKVGDREMVLRRPPFGSKVKSAHDMSREYKILSAIHPVYDRVPRPLAYCEDESVIGARFYVMERIRGVILRRTLPDGLTLPPETVERLARNLIKNLAEIHAIDYEAVGLGAIARVEGFLARQVNGWADRYYGSQTHEIPGVEQVIQWTRENVPASPPATLIHNDYKYDNMVLDGKDITRIIGVLDWEMSTVGDPLMDLGVALSYWVQADDPPELLSSAFGPTAAPGSPTRKQLADYYAELTGRDVSNLHYYLCFAMFKLAVILQQIYYRFAKGHTHDERFGPLIDMVKLLVRTAEALIERGHI